MDAVKTAGIAVAAALAGSAVTYQVLQASPTPSASNPTQAVAQRPIETRIEAAPAADCPPVGVAATKEGRAMPEPNSAEPTKDTALASEVLADIRRQLEQENKHINRFREFIANSDSQSPIDLAQETFDQEEVDYGWASTQEEELLSLFSADERLETFSPLQLSCKSESCQVVVAAEDNRQAQTIYEAFLQAVTATDTGQERVVSYFDDPATGQLVMYVSRTGATLFQE